MKKTVLLALFALASAAFIAPQAKADTWSNLYLVNQEYSNTKINGVNNVLKDGRGHVWVRGYCRSVGSVSYGCLHEYTGTEWIDHSDTLNNLIQENTISMSEIGPLGGEFPMYIDSSGNLWIDQAILAYYNGSNWHVEDAQALWEQVLGVDVPINDINDITFQNMFGDDDGNLYVLGGISYTGVGGESTNRLLKRNAQGVWSTAISGAVMDPLGTYCKLRGKFNNTTGEIWYQYDRYYGHNGEAVGVYRYHNGAWINYTTADGLPSNVIEDMLIDSTGNVWVTTTEGISKFDGSSWTTWNTSNSNLASNSISQISEDNDNRIWFISLTGANQDKMESISIYDQSANEWSYYSSRNADDSFLDISKVFHLSDKMWAVDDWSNGRFVILDKTTPETTIYGQTSGDVVSKAGFDMARKKKKKTPAINNKAVTIYKITRVKKKKKYKTVKSLVYRTGATQWYKALNLDTGKYQVVSKARGKKKHTRTINITSGDPYRLDLRY
jgi:hypothetical protein